MRPTFFFDSLAVSGILAYVLMNNEVQFTSTSFEALRITLVVKILATTAYYPQMNGQVKKYNRAIVTRLRLYVSENQKD